jgi:hypothetical protein
MKLGMSHVTTQKVNKKALLIKKFIIDENEIEVTATSKVMNYFWSQFLHLHLNLFVIKLCFKNKSLIHFKRVLLVTF